jgi:hypothetical protein
MANVFGTPLGLNAVYTIASGFIAECPSTNMKLPVMAYPDLAAVTGLPVAPSVLLDLLPGAMPKDTYFVTFVSGLDIVPVMPPMIQGQSYVFLTSDNSGNLTDATILAGPAIIEVTPDSPTFDLTIT